MLSDRALQDTEAPQRLLERIRTRSWATGAEILQHGEDLAALKDLLGHDLFAETIRKQLGYSAWKCGACIKAYEEFSRHKDVAGALPADILLRLCQKTTPPSLRNRLRKAWRRGECHKPDIILQMVFSARDAEKEAARRAKQSLAKRRKLSLRPRAERERQKRELDRERRFDAAKAALRMLEPDCMRAVARFLDRAEPRECKELTGQLVNELRT